MAKELDIKFETSALDELARELRGRLGSDGKADNVFTRHMVAAIKAAMKPGVPSAMWKWKQKFTN